MDNENVYASWQPLDFANKTLDELKSMRNGFNLKKVRNDQQDLSYLIRMIDILLEKVELLENPGPQDLGRLRGYKISVDDDNGIYRCEIYKDRKYLKSFDGFADYESASMAARSFILEMVASDE